MRTTDLYQVRGDFARGQRTGAGSHRLYRYEVVDAAELLAQSGIAATVVAYRRFAHATPKHCWQR